MIKRSDVQMTKLSHTGILLHPTRENEKFAHHRTVDAGQVEVVSVRVVEDRAENRDAQGFEILRVSVFDGDQ